MPHKPIKSLSTSAMVQPTGTQTGWITMSSANTRTANPDQQHPHLSSSCSSAEMKKWTACAFSSTKNDSRPKKWTTPAMASEQAAQQALPITRDNQRSFILRCSASPRCSCLPRRSSAHLKWLAACPAMLTAVGGDPWGRWGRKDLQTQRDCPVQHQMIVRWGMIWLPLGLHTTKSLTHRSLSLHAAVHASVHATARTVPCTCTYIEKAAKSTQL